MASQRKDSGDLPHRTPDPSPQRPAPGQIGRQEPPPLASRTGNQLIAALPPGEAELVLAQCQRIPLQARQPLARRGKPIEYLYFPLSGIVSLVVSMYDGATVEMATIGREGVVGIPMALRASAGADAMVQVNGEALRIPVDRFRFLLTRTHRLQELLGQFEGVLFQLVGQNAACNRLHTTRQRLCRWLLMVQDRADSPYELTHEFLAMMLGVRRASVSKAAEELRARGLITYTQGQVRILDRPQLEALSCECYGSIREAFEGLYS